MKKLTVLISAVFISICPMLAMGPSLEDTQDVVTKDVHITSVDIDGNLREIIFTPAQANSFRLFRDLAGGAAADGISKADEILNFTGYPHLSYETLAQVQYLATSPDAHTMANFVHMLSGQQACALICAVHFLGLNKEILDCMLQHIGPRLVEEKEFFEPCMAYARATNSVEILASILDEANQPVKSWHINEQLVNHPHWSNDTSRIGLETNTPRQSHTRLNASLYYDCLTGTPLGPVSKVPNTDIRVKRFPGEMGELSDDGSLLVIEHWEPTNVTVYSVPSHQEIARFPEYFYLDMSSNGLTLALSSGRAITLFNLPEKRKILTIPDEADELADKLLADIVGPWLLLSHGYCGDPVNFICISDVRRSVPIPGQIQWIDKQALLVAIKQTDNYTLYFLGDETAPRIVAEIKSDETGTTYSNYFGTQTPVERLLALAQLHESTPSAASPTSEIVREPTPIDVLPKITLDTHTIDTESI